MWTVCIDMVTFQFYGTELYVMYFMLHIIISILLKLVRIKC